jgi:hypothetical protein
MNTQTQTRPAQISKPLKSAINSRAHYLARQNEPRLRAVLLAQIMAAQQGGASPQELLALVAEGGA